jgi:hypothetical protein
MRYKFLVLDTYHPDTDYLREKACEDPWFLIFISPCIFNIFPNCNQQDATSLNLFVSTKRSTCFRRFLRPSSGAQIVHTVSGICQTLLLPAVIMIGMELLLSWLGWNCNSIPTLITAGSRKVWQIPEAVCTIWAPDNGRRNRLKHVEHFIEINKLRNVASCWLHFGNTLVEDLCYLLSLFCFPLLNVSRNPSF